MLAILNEIANSTFNKQLSLYKTSNDEPYKSNREQFNKIVDKFKPTTKNNMDEEALSHYQKIRSAQMNKKAFDALNEEKIVPKGFFEKYTSKFKYPEKVEYNSNNANNNQPAKSVNSKYMLGLEVNVKNDGFSITVNVTNRENFVRAITEIARNIVKHNESKPDERFFNITSN